MSMWHLARGPSLGCGGGHNGSGLEHSSARLLPSRAAWMNFTRGMSKVHVNGYLPLLRSLFTEPWRD